MSIKIMSQVWENSKQSGAGLLLLLALADHADDEGYCFPGIARLAKKTRKSARAVQQSIAELVAAGELTVNYNQGIDTQSGKTNLYRIIIPQEVKETSPLKEGVKKVAPEGVKETSPQGVKETSPKPSVQPSDQPSIGGSEIEDFIPGLQQRKQTEYQPVKPGTPEAIMLALGITAKNNNPLAEQIEDLHNYGWHIKQANVETAIAAFLTATQLHIPTVTAERKKWIAGAEAHIQEFGVEGLAARYKAAWDEVFPKILDGQLDITHPAALTFKLRAQLQRNHLAGNKPVAAKYIDPQDPRNWKALGYTE